MMHVESEFFWKPYKCEEGHGCRDGQDDNAIQDHLGYEEAYTDTVLLYKCQENKSEADACEALQISVPNDAYGLYSNRCGIRCRYCKRTHVPRWPIISECLSPLRSRPVKTTSIAAEHRHRGLHVKDVAQTASYGESRLNPGS